ncbi:MAG: RuBisCO large subunit C-terminal-like domain-containing protein [Pirellulaceae bacterium]
MIKDDHGLADQCFVRFQERVERLSDAVNRANRETGCAASIFPNITAPLDQLLDRARLARQAGAGGYLIAPGLAGWDAMLRCRRRSLRLTDHESPGILRSVHDQSLRGISHGAFYGRIARLAGADATIFPNYGGRFAFSTDECRDIVAGCDASLGDIRPIFPAPAGGMKVQRVPELCDFYGKDTVLLIGGDLHRHGSDLVQSCRQFAESVRSNC